MWEAWSEARARGQLASLPGPSLSVCRFISPSPASQALQCKYSFKQWQSPRGSWFIGAERVPGVEMAFGTRGPRKADQGCSRSARLGAVSPGLLGGREESQGLSGLCLRKTPEERAPKILPGQEWFIGVTRFLFGKRKKNHFLDTWATLQKRGPSSTHLKPCPAL